MSARLVAIFKNAGWLRLSIAWRIAPMRSAALIPPQIKDYGLLIPACLAKVVTATAFILTIDRIKQIIDR